MVFRPYRDPRASIAGLALLAALLASSCLSEDVAPGAIAETEIGRYRGGEIVQLSAGLVQGQADRDGTMAWRGIPYAKPPVGDLRWRAPVPPAAWTGIRKALTFGNQAVQILPVIERTAGSEDCLYLNVWRPADDRQGLPVIVWIHGGANTAGGSNFYSEYYGHAIASSQSLVFVSINYRLGPLGWLYDPALSSPMGGEFESSGNFGTLDIIEALRWVKREIASFGGDPDLVTVMGESAGGQDVLSLLCARGTEGLFKGAIAMSPITTSFSKEEAWGFSQGLLADLIVADKARAGRGFGDPELALETAKGMEPKERAAYLRAAEPEALFASLKGGNTGMADWPTLYRDGDLLPIEGFDSFKSGAYPNKVPLMIGSTRDELGVFLFLDPVLKYEDPEYPAALRYGSELWRARYVDEIALAISASEGSAPVYSYRFDWGSPAADGSSVLPLDLGKRVGAFHGLDVPFFLGTDPIIVSALGRTVLTQENKSMREALSSRIVAYIGSFARDGDPNGPWIDPVWPPFSGLDPSWLDLGDPDSNGLVKPRKGYDTVEAIAERMKNALGEDGARKAMGFLPFFMRGFPYQAP